MAESLYDIMGVPRDASADEIKSAYRKAAKTHHPDLNPGNTAAADRFKAISSAYAILGDEALRRRYDRGEIDASGQEAQQRQRSYYRDHAGTSAGNRYEDQESFADFGDQSELFAELLRRARAGEGTRARRPMPGRDRHYFLSVSFLEAARGGERMLAMPDGSDLKVTIPAGLKDGQSLRLKGDGGLNGGPAGDALIEITVESHPLFRRDGDNILITVPISLTEAALGGQIEVPTLHGKLKLTIPPGSSSGQKLRLKQQGIKAKGRPPGHQYVELSVMLPDASTFDDEIKAALASWSKRHPYDARATWAKGVEL